MLRLLKSLFPRPRATGRRAAPRPRVQLALEGLEDRTVPTVVFQPHFAGEAVLNNGGQTSALKSSTVIVEYQGAYWATAQGQADKAAMTRDVQTILAGPYLSGLSQYTANHSAVQATFGGSFTNLSALPNGFAPRTAAGGLDWSILDQRVHLSGATSSTPLYVFVTDPNVASGSPWGGYNEPADAANGGRRQIWVSTKGAQPAGIDFDGFTQLFSHELAESMSGNVTVQLPSQFAKDGSQIADGEPEAPSAFNSALGGKSYGYRVNGLLLQPYWSQQENGGRGAFIVPDGGTQTIVLTPVWNGSTFTGQYQGMPADVIPSPGATVAEAAGGQTFVVFNTDRRLWEHDSAGWHDLHKANVASISVGADGVLDAVLTGGDLYQYSLATGVWGSQPLVGGVNSVAEWANGQTYISWGSAHHLWEHDGTGWHDRQATGVAALSAGTGDVLDVVFTDHTAWRFRISTNTWLNQVTAPNLGPITSMVEDAIGHVYVIAGSGNKVYQMTATGPNYLGGSGAAWLGMGANGVLDVVFQDTGLWQFFTGANRWGTSIFASGVSI